MVLWLACWIFTTAIVVRIPVMLSVNPTCYPYEVGKMGGSLVTGIKKGATLSYSLVEANEKGAFRLPLTSIGYKKKNIRI